MEPFNLLFADDSSPSPAVATFKVDLASLYNVMCHTLKDDQVTLFLYLLLHRNPQYKAFVLSRTNIDQLVSIQSTEAFSVAFFFFFSFFSNNIE